MAEETKDHGPAASQPVGTSTSPTDTPRKAFKALSTASLYQKMAPCAATSSGVPAALSDHASGHRHHSLRATSSQSPSLAPLKKAITSLSSASGTYKLASWRSSTPKGSILSPGTSSTGENSPNREASPSGEINSAWKVATGSPVIPSAIVPIVKTKSPANSPDSGAQNHLKSTQISLSAKPAFDSTKSASISFDGARNNHESSPYAKKTTQLPKKESSSSSSSSTTTTTTSSSAAVAAAADYHLPLESSRAGFKWDEDVDDSEWEKSLSQSAKETLKNEMASEKPSQISNRTTPTITGTTLTASTLSASNPIKSTPAPWSNMKPVAQPLAISEQLKELSLQKQQKEQQSIPSASHFSGRIGHVTVLNSSRPHGIGISTAPGPGQLAGKEASEDSKRYRYPDPEKRYRSDEHPVRQELYSERTKSFESTDVNALSKQPRHVEKLPTLRGSNVPIYSYRLNADGNQATNPPREKNGGAESGEKRTTEPEFPAQEAKPTEEETKRLLEEQKQEMKRALERARKRKEEELRKEREQQEAVKRRLEELKREAQAAQNKTSNSDVPGASQDHEKVGTLAQKRSFSRRRSTSSENSKQIIQSVNSLIRDEGEGEHITSSIPVNSDRKSTPNVSSQRGSKSNSSEVWPPTAPRSEAWDPATSKSKSNVEGKLWGSSKSRPGHGSSILSLEDSKAVTDAWKPAVSNTPVANGIFNPHTNPPRTASSVPAASSAAQTSALNSTADDSISWRRAVPLTVPQAQNSSRVREKDKGAVDQANPITSPTYKSNNKQPVSRMDYLNADTTNPPIIHSYQSRVATQKALVSGHSKTQETPPTRGHSRFFPSPQTENKHSSYESQRAEEDSGDLSTQNVASADSTTGLWDASTPTIYPSEMSQAGVFMTAGLAGRDPSNLHYDGVEMSHHKYHNPGCLGSIPTSVPHVQLPASTPNHETDSTARDSASEPSVSVPLTVPAAAIVSKAPPQQSRVETIGNKRTGDSSVSKLNGLVTDSDKNAVSTSVNHSCLPYIERKTQASSSTLENLLFPSFDSDTQVKLNLASIPSDYEVSDGIKLLESSLIRPSLNYFSSFAVFLDNLRSTTPHTLSMPARKPFYRETMSSFDITRSADVKLPQKI